MRTQCRCATAPIVCLCPRRGTHTTIDNLEDLFQNILSPLEVIVYFASRGFRLTIAMGASLPVGGGHCHGPSCLARKIQMRRGPSEPKHAPTAARWRSL